MNFESLDYAIFILKSNLAGNAAPKDQALARSHKSLSGAARRTAAKQILQRFPFDGNPIFQAGNRIIARRQSSSLYCGKPGKKWFKGVWLLLPAIDDKGGFGEDNLFPLRAKRSRLSRRLTHLYESKLEQEALLPGS